MSKEEIKKKFDRALSDKFSFTANIFEDIAPFALVDFISEYIDQETSAVRQEVEKVKEKQHRLLYSDLHTILKNEVNTATFEGVVSLDGTFTGRVNLNRLTSSLNEYMSIKASDIKNEQIQSLSARVSDLEGQLEYCNRIITVVGNNPKCQEFLPTHVIQLIQELLTSPQGDNK